MVAYFKNCIYMKSPSVLKPTSVPKRSFGSIRSKIQLKSQQLAFFQTQCLIVSYYDSHCLKSVLGKFPTFRQCAIFFDSLKTAE